MIRLDKFLCDAGIGSRSEVKMMIKKGRIRVDGVLQKSPEYKLEEGKAAVSLDGQPVRNERFSYYMLYKPAGVVSATRDERERTVLDLLEGAPGKNLAPVGRLDKDTEGLLLITNDGALAHRLLSPKKHVDKTYLVHTAKPVTGDMLDRLQQGLDIGDEKPTLPARAQILSDRENGLLLTITEGRYHQVKRMLEAVDNEVVYLKRLSMGPLALEEGLGPGGFRPLTEEEKERLGVLGSC